MKVPLKLFCLIFVIFCFHVEESVCFKGIWGAVHVFLKGFLPLFTESFSSESEENMMESFYSLEIENPFFTTCKPPEQTETEEYDSFFTSFVKYYEREEDLPRGVTYVKPAKNHEFAYISGLMASLQAIPFISKCRYFFDDVIYFKEKVKAGEKSLDDLGILCIGRIHVITNCYPSLPIDDSCPTKINLKREPDSESESSGTEMPSDSEDLIPLLPIPRNESETTFIEKPSDFSKESEATIEEDLSDYKDLIPLPPPYVPITEEQPDVIKEKERLESISKSNIFY